MRNPIVKASELRYLDRFILDGEVVSFCSSYTNSDGDFVIAWQPSPSHTARRLVTRANHGYVLVSSFESVCRRPDARFAS